MSERLAPLRFQNSSQRSVAKEIHIQKNQSKEFTSTK
jgi:hypothetical protein